MKKVGKTKMKSKKKKKYLVLQNICEFWSGNIIICCRCRQDGQFVVIDFGKTANSSHEQSFKKNQHLRGLYTVAV